MLDSAWQTERAVSPGSGNPSHFFFWKYLKLEWLSVKYSPRIIVHVTSEVCLFYLVLGLFYMYRLIEDSIFGNYLCNLYYVLVIYI